MAAPQASLTGIAVSGGSRKHAEKPKCGTFSSHSSLKQLGCLDNPTCVQWSSAGPCTSQFPRHPLIPLIAPPHPQLDAHNDPIMLAE